MGSVKIKIPCLRRIFHIKDRQCQASGCYGEERSLWGRDVGEGPTVRLGRVQLVRSEDRLISSGSFEFIRGWRH